MAQTVWRGRAPDSEPTPLKHKELTMYIGLGTLVVILLVVVVISMMRRTRVS